MRFLSLAVVLLSCGLLCSAAWAHDPGLSSASLAVSGHQLELVTTFANNDARWLLPEGTKETDFNAGSTRDAFAKSVLTLWHLRAAHRDLNPVSTQITAAAGNNIAVTQLFDDGSATDLEFTTEIFELLPPGHRQHFSVTLGENRLLLAKLLSTDQTSVSLVLPAQASLAKIDATPSVADRVSFTEFLRLGIEHILTGYDHLLFLFAFLITVKGIKPILKIITSFTVAHSITLALSALNIVYVPSRFIEPLIAATIVFVALQNIFRRDRLGERAALTFAFGLIHGFGFAAVLRDMGISSLGSSAWRALGGFNLGVEIGQLAVASVILPILWYLKTRPNYMRIWMPTASAAVVLAGTFWFIQRVTGA